MPRDESAGGKRCASQPFEDPREYNLVAISEAPDAETATAVLLQLGSTGNVRTTTLPAFEREEMEKISAKAG